MSACQLYALGSDKKKFFLRLKEMLPGSQNILSKKQTVDQVNIRKEWLGQSTGIVIVKNIARIANAVQVILVYTSVY